MSNFSAIKITKTQKSLLSETSLKDIPFGKIFTDHMLVADYADGAWQSVEILPYQPLSFSPALSALHYGQSIFEGMKAYLNVRGEMVIFRPYDHFARFNESAERMAMPALPDEIFIGGMKELIRLDKAWIPTAENHSLYIRPFMFSTEEFLGVHTSTTYKFIILLSPSGPYYGEPSRIAVEEKYTRAAPGGTGRAKNAGNYGASLKPAVDAALRGYDQVLWTDPFEHKWLQEVGTMNVMFVLKDRVITPSLDEGTILDGVTRRSAIVILKEMGVKVEERKISIDELAGEYKKGNLVEAFGTGTAATISPIKELGYKNEHLIFDLHNNQISSELGKRLSDIRLGIAEDTHGWVVKI